MTAASDERVLSWQLNGQGPARLVEWRFSPPRPPERTSRAWDVPGPIAFIACTPRGRVVLRSGQGVYVLDAASPGDAPLLRELAPRITAGTAEALALSPDASRFALALHGDEGRPSVLVSRIDWEKATPALESMFKPRGRFVSSLLVDEQDVVVCSGGSVGANGVEVRATRGGGSRQVPTTTVPVLAARDPTGRLWVGTESFYLHQIDSRQGIVVPQVAGVGAKSQFGQGEMILPASHNGTICGVRFARLEGALCMWSISSNAPPFVRAPEPPTPEYPRELRTWRAQPDGSWANVGGVRAWPAPLGSLDVSPDGRWILIGCGGELELWSVDSIPSAHAAQARLSTYEQALASARAR